MLSLVSPALLWTLLPTLHAQTVTVDIAPKSATNHFVPETTLGAGIDRLSTEAVDKAFTKENLARVAPFRLAIHHLPSEHRTRRRRRGTGNPEGTWSDPKGRGYFTGSTDLGQPDPLFLRLRTAAARLHPQ